MNAEEQRSQQCLACNGDTAHLSAADWQARYDTGKTGWDRGEASPMLAQWLRSGELRPCEILVPGCGRGHEVIALAEAGFKVTAIDFADSAVTALRAELERRSLSADVVQSDVLTFCRSSTFDAVYEQTCLCALHPSQWQTYQQLLACWLRKGGQLFAMFMQSNSPDGPPYACEIDVMQDLFVGPTWQWSDQSTRVEHPNGNHEVACVLTRG